MHLAKDGARRAGALAEAVHSDPSTVSRQVAHLVQLGLVERVADPADGRATLLVATDEGRRVFDENRRLRNRGIATLMSDWPDDDRQAFVQLLTRFTDSFESHKARTGPPGPEASAARMYRKWLSAHPTHPKPLSVHPGAHYSAGPCASASSAFSACSSFARWYDALISRSASARPTQVAPSTLLPGSRSL